MPVPSVTVCRSEDLPLGGTTSAQLGPIPLAVVRTKTGALYALVDKCLHQGGPLSRGNLGWSSPSSRVVGEYHVEHDGEILRCPWHNYAYDVTTGCLTIDPTRKLRTFRVWEEDGEIKVDMQQSSTSTNVPA